MAPGVSDAVEADLVPDTTMRDLLQFGASEREMGFLDIISPCGDSILRYYFVREEIEEQTLCNNVSDLLGSSLEDYPEALEAFKPFVLESKRSKTVDAARELNNHFTRIVKEFIKNPPEKGELTKIKADPLNMLLGLVYNRNIERVKDLNAYTPFSPETYGETTFEFVLSFIEELGITENDTFLDLGSGVGNVVIQVAALCLCKKLIGIEIVEARAKFAEKMDKEFRVVMAWLGKKYGDYQLIHGDFLDYRDTILNSNIIFCNNYAFTPKLNLQLKVIFADLPERVKILVSRSLTDEKFRIYDAKTANDASAVMPVRKTLPGKVSWTDSDVIFFLHEVDRTMLDKFMKSRDDPELRAQFDEEQRRNRPNYYESSSEQDSQGIERDRSDFESDDETKPRRRIVTRNQAKTMGGGGRRGRPKELDKELDEDSDQTETADENENSPSAMDMRSEASSDRTRSLPSQESTTGPKPGVKRKRGRPPKSTARSAPSSSGSSTKLALQTLFKRTVKSVTDVDRSEQPGCEISSIDFRLEEEVPEHIRDCLKKMEKVLMTFHLQAKQPAFLESVTESHKEQTNEMKRLKARHDQAFKDVAVLRKYCKDLLMAYFDTMKLPLPKSQKEFREASRVVVQNNQLLKNRHDTLKDDIAWLKNAQKVTVFFPPNMTAAFPAAKKQDAQSKTSKNPQIVDKHSQRELPADVVDLSRQPRKESKEVPAIKQNAPHSSSKHTSPSPQLAQKPTKGPTYLSAIDRVIEDTLLRNPLPPSNRNAQPQNIGNFRGISPVAPPIKEEKARMNLPVPSPNTPSSTPTNSKPPTPMHAYPYPAAGGNMPTIDNSGKPYGNVAAGHAGLSATPPNIPVMNSGQMASFMAPYMGSYGIPYGLSGMAAGMNPYNPAPQPSVPDQNMINRQNPSMWPSGLPGQFFDNPLHASMSASFSAVPGSGRKDDPQTSTRTATVESISPPV